MGLLIEPVDMEMYEFVRMKQREEWGVSSERTHRLLRRMPFARETWLEYRW